MSFPPSIPRGLHGADLLGLPEWWCVATVFIGSLIIAFLVYAYYKGKSMMKNREKATGIKSMRCSSCGTFLKENALRCPGCKAVFTGDRFVCPGCGRDTLKDDPKCGYCETSLRKVKVQLPGKRTQRLDPDLAKLRKGPRTKGLTECPTCGAFFEPGSRCPVCSSRR